MKVLVAAVLLWLLCGPPAAGPTGAPEQPGARHALEEDQDNEDPGLEGYDDDDDDDEEEETGRGGGRLQCLFCQALHSQERCHDTWDCSPSQAFCKGFVSRGHTESGPVTTYSAWCSDECHPSSRTVEGTLMTVTCCQQPLCNVPPWQATPGGRGAGGRGSPPPTAAVLLLSLPIGLYSTGP